MAEDDNVVDHGAAANRSTLNDMLNSGELRNSEHDNTGDPIGELVEQSLASLSTNQEAPNLQAAKKEADAACRHHKGSFKAEHVPAHRETAFANCVSTHMADKGLKR